MSESDPSLLQRLKDRKFVQWGLAYLAVALPVAGVLELAAEPWGIPAGAERVVHVLLVMGFLLTLVLAWYHGEMGRQRISGSEMVILAGLLVVGGMALRWIGPGEDAPVAGGVGAETSEDGARPAIAVLPIHDASPEPNNAYFVEGLHEDIMNALGRISSLQVSARASVDQYKEDRPTSREIATALGVDYLLEGSARIVGGLFRVNVRLIDGQVDGQLWQNEYTADFDPKETIRIQGEIAEAVASELKVGIAPEEEAQIAFLPTTNTEAWRLFNRGRSQLRMINAVSYGRAVQYFRGALELDSTFAGAHAGLGEAFAWFAMGNVEAPEETWPHVWEGANAALSLDENLATAHYLLGLETMYYRHDMEAAEGAFLRAIEIDPDRADSRAYYSWLLAFLGREEEALAQMNAAKALDPTDPWVDAMRAWDYHLLGRLDDALAISQGLSASEVGGAWADILLVQTLIQQGAYEEAIAPLQAWMIPQGDDISEEIALLVMLNGLTGRHEEAAQQLELLMQRVADGYWVSPVNWAWVAIGQGDLDRAMDHLEEARERRDLWIWWVASAEFMTPNVGDHPRFKALRRSMGLE